MAAGTALALQCLWLTVTGSLSIVFWIPCMAAAVGMMFLVRFNGLDYRMLRTVYGHKLPLVAGCLLEENLLDAFRRE